MSEKRPILLVDDCADDLFFMHSAFKKAEFNTPLQEVHNGVDAIAYLKGEGVYSDRDAFPLPILMLLDLNMPMKSGFDVLKWVRAQSGLKHMPAIVLTASTRMEDVEHAFDLGATDFLVKPRTVKGLTDMIRRLRDWIEINHFPPLNEVVKR